MQKQQLRVEGRRDFGPMMIGSSLLQFRVGGSGRAEEGVTKWERVQNENSGTEH